MTRSTADLKASVPVCIANLTQTSIYLVGIDGEPQSCHEVSLIASSVMNCFGRGRALYTVGSAITGQVGSPGLSKMIIMIMN